MLSLSFELNETKVQTKLNKALAGLKDMRKPFTASSEALIPYFSEAVFETQGTALGQSWRKLAESTLRARASKSGYYSRPAIATDKILVWTGRMKSSYRSEIKRDQLRIFNVSPYFQYHQKGDRKMLGLNAFVIKTVKAEFNRFAKSLLT